MKKKLVTGALLCAFGAVAVTGGTLAYFTDTDDATNTFTVGNVDIMLDETDIDNPQNRTQEGNDYTNIMPGMSYTKDPIVHNQGKNDAYVRVKVTITDGYTFMPTVGSDDIWDETMYEEAFLALVGELGDGWTITACNDGIMDHWPSGDTSITYTLTYANKLAAGEQTSPVFENITIPASWTQDDERIQVIQQNGFNMNIVAEAIQADGLTDKDNNGAIDVTDAFAAFDAE